MGQLGFKGVQHKAHQTVLVTGNVHSPQVVPQEGDAFAHQILRGGNPAGHHGLVHLGLFAQVVHQAAVILGDHSAAVLDGDFLLGNESGDEGGNVDLFPTVGDSLIPTLHIPHGDGGTHRFQLQPLADLIESILVIGPRTHQAEVGVCAAVENGQNVSVALHEMVDHVQLGVNALHQTAESGVQLVFGIPGLDGHDLAVDHHFGIYDCLFQVAFGPFLQVAGLLLPLANDVLDGLRQLGDVLLLDIFANLHGLLQLVIIGCIAGEDHNGLVVDLGFHDELLVGVLIVVTGHGDNSQADTAAGGAVEGLVNVLVIGKVIPAMLELFGRIDFPKYRLGNALGDLGRVHHRVFDVNGDILFFIRQEGVSVPVARNIVLGLQPLQRCGYRSPESNLIRADVIHHQGGDVVNVGLDVIDIAHQVKQFQDCHILRLNAIMVIRCILAAVDHPANGTLQEGMDGVVEQIKGQQGVFVLVLHLLSGFLEAGEHGTLAAREVLAGVSVLSDLCQHLLNDDKLVGYKGESGSKFSAVSKALDVQNRVVEDKEVLQNGLLLVIDHVQELIGLFRLGQHTLFDDLIHRGGGQAQAGIEAPLNFGEVVSSNFHHRVNGLLTGNHDPDLAHALGTQFLHKRLKVDH